MQFKTFGTGIYYFKLNWSMVALCISSEGHLVNSCEFTAMTTTRAILLVVYFLLKSVIGQNTGNNCKTPEQEDGYCVSVQECQYGVNATVFCENGDQVCCPKKAINATAYRSEDTQSLHKNAQLLPRSSCGFESSSRGRGAEADIEDYRWLVLLKYQKDGDPYLCGGSLINKNHVLTAAHCIKNVKYNLIGVRLNEYDIRTDPDCVRFHVWRNRDGVVKCKLSHRDFNVSKEDTIVHPEYSPDNMENDIGLIKLKKNIDTDRNSISYLCLPITVGEKSSERTAYKVAGWGASDLGLSTPILLQGYARTVNETICVKSFGKNLTTNDICASTRYTGRRCVTDDGGPIISYFGKESRFFLNGIATRMPSTCDTDDIFVGYLKINPYIDWILDNIST